MADSCVRRELCRVASRCLISALGNLLEDGGKETDEHRLRQPPGWSALTHDPKPPLKDFRVMVSQEVPKGRG